MECSVMAHEMDAYSPTNGRVGCLDRSGSRLGLGAGVDVRARRWVCSLSTGQVILLLP
jgi:hypothetical protein